MNGDTGFDFFILDDHLNDNQRQLRLQVREYVEEFVLPAINPYWEQGKFPREIAFGLKSLPIMGTMIKGYGCAGLDPLSAGIVRYELGRGDGSIGTFYGVHSGLAMGTIGLLGSNDQKKRWLPQMARLEKIGAWGLTEPERGSDAANILTTARREKEGYLLNGKKRWIGNAAIADIIIIWARDEKGKFGGFIIEDPKTVPGVTIENIGGKISKRAVLNADIDLQNVFVPLENRLVNVDSFRDVTKILVSTRYTIGWEAAGIASACLDYALEFAKNRDQFGKRIAGFQLIQQKLVDMASEVSQMLLLCFRMAELMEKVKITSAMVSLVKYNNARKARIVTRLAREIFGGDGILIENHVARLMLDAEAIYTYEGTNEINLLIVGRELTGMGAFF
jgi:glutaryl-CoA dehydrogenase